MFGLRVGFAKGFFMTVRNDDDQVLNRYRIGKDTLGQDVLDNYKGRLTNEHLFGLKYRSKDRFGMTDEMDLVHKKDADVAEDINWRLGCVFAKKPQQQPENVGEGAVASQVANTTAATASKQAKEVWRNLWMHPQVKIMSRQKLVREQVLLNRFQVILSPRYFPEDVEEIILSNDLVSGHDHCCCWWWCTFGLMSWLQFRQQQIFFFMKVKSDLHSDYFPCPDSIAVLLAVYACHATNFGGGGRRRHNLDTIKRLLPPRENWRHLSEKMLAPWSELIASLSVSDARAEFLRLAAMLPSFGATYYPVMNKDLKVLWVGVGPLGLMVHRRKQGPVEIFFSYDELGRFDNPYLNCCTIKLAVPRERSARLFSFKTEALKFNAFTARQARTIGETYTTYSKLYQQGRQQESTVAAHRQMIVEKKKAREEVRKRNSQLLIVIDDEDEDMAEFKYHPDYAVTHWIDPDFAPTSGDRNCKF